MKKLCIYHGNCADGFGAAYAVRKRYGEDVEFYPGVYQTPPPDVTGRDVIMVDFSYKRPVIEQMVQQANSLLILDHHKSAEEDLRQWKTEGPEEPQDFDEWDSMIRLSPGIVCAIFDMERSGAMMAWSFFHPFEPIPQLFKHIQDRALWRFELPGTREIQAALFSYPYDFALWDELVNSFDMAGGSQMLAEGAAIERKHFKDIDELLKVTAQRMVIAGHVVPVANLPYTMSSDAGHQLAQGEKFAACYWDTPDGRVFSLRSSEEGLDVSEIAKKFGGGGHRHAAGFKLSPGMTLGQANLLVLANNPAADSTVTVAVG